MVQKVTKGRGGGEFPLRLRGLAFLLSFLLLFLTPLTAFGYGVVESQYDRIDVLAYSKTDGPIWQQENVYGKDVVFRKQFNDKEQSDLKTIQIFVDFTETVNKGDILQFDFSMPLSRYKGFDFTVTASTYTVNGVQSKKFFETKGTVNGDTEYSDGDVLYSYSYGGTIASAEAFHFENAAKFTYTGKVRYSIVIDNFKYSTAGASELPLYVALENFVVAIESPETGNTKKLLSGLSSIIEYIKGIVQSITELPSKIGTFINSLGDKISGFFSNLTNNLSTWFSNIGKWFTDLGNNIKTWFTNLINNMSNFFTSLGDRISGFFTTIWNNTVEFFTGLFKPSDDYFEKLRDDLDKHMSEHLGFVYTFPKKMLEEVKTVVNAVKTADGKHLYLFFPDIEFTVIDTTYKIGTNGTYDLLAFYSQMPSVTKTLIDVAFGIMHALIDIWLIRSVGKMIYRKIINKVGVEGGDDL